MILCALKALWWLSLLTPSPLRHQDAKNHQEPDQNLIFSHRTHLGKVRADCADCHASALTSTTAEENNLPKESACLRCHDGLRAGKECALCHKNPQSVRSMSLPQRSFRFNHKLHLIFGNAAPVLARAIDSGSYLSPPGNIRRFLNTENPCVPCHRGVSETDLAAKENLPRMADCLVCHIKIDPPFSCAYCHTPEATLKPASHTARFGDLHSSRQAVPDKTTCKVCHGVKFTCMGCH